MSGLLYYVVVLGVPAGLTYGSELERRRPHKQAARAAAGTVAFMGALLLAEAFGSWLRGY